MPLSLNNSKDIVANSISLLKGNTVVDLLALLDTETSTTYTNQNIDDLLDLKVDDVELSSYAPKASPSFTGDVNMSGATVHQFFLIMLMAHLHLLRGRAGTN